MRPTRLIETTRTGTTVEPIYNGVNDRVGQTVGLSTTNYALDVAGGLPEVIYTSEGNLYLHLPGVIVAESGTGEVRYLLSDGLGSVRQAVDENGEVVAYNEFDPYGNPIHHSSFIDQPYGYTGEWWENDIGLLHLRARWYAPETGTFLSRDPVESEPPYLYVWGNPVNFTDPTGHKARYPGACDDWSWPIKARCLIANNDSVPGSLLAIEDLYRLIVWGNRAHFGWYVAANLLDHYLDGTEGDTPDNAPGPGEPFFIRDREWILSTEDDKIARETMINTFVNDYLKPAAASCTVGPISGHLRVRGINPPGSTEVKNSLGNHTMQAIFNAWMEGEEDFTTDVTVDFFIEDKYDFDPQKVIAKGPVASLGVGTVPHVWLVDLARAGWAAEFQNHVEWKEQLRVEGSANSTEFKVDRIK